MRLAAGVKTEVEFVGQLTSQCLHGRHERNDQNEDDWNENDEGDDRGHARAHTPVLPTLERSFLPLKQILATSGNARESFEAVLQHFRLRFRNCLLFVRSAGTVTSLS